MKLSRQYFPIVLTALPLMLSPSIAMADQQPMFGRLFPDLPHYEAPDDAALTALTVAANPDGSIGPMVDPSITGADNNPDRLPAFFTYFGQFIDHDLTLDTLPLPTEFVDPATIPNNRNPRFNLDSVYGKGPEQNPELYQADLKHLKVNGLDLPRNPAGTAILGDGRNDENQIIAQLHTLFLRAHNRLIDSGYSLPKARELMKYRYQWIVVHEFLQEVISPDVYNDVFLPSGDIQLRFYDPKKATRAEMPVEFSVAAYRFGHSMVRSAYVIAQFTPPAQPVRVSVFNGTADDLHGGRPIAPDHIIFWPNFLPVDGQPAPANISRKIDTLIASSLFTLPTQAVPVGSLILAKRNLQRAREYGLPSGQAVATRINQDLPAAQQFDVYSNADIIAAIPRLGGLAASGYQGEAPLWLYILAESQIVHNGAKLGPAGSRIVAEVMAGLLATDNKSYFCKGWVPPGGDYTAQDFLRHAGVL